MNNEPQMGMIRLVVRADCTPDCLRRAGELVRQIPVVARVRTDEPSRQLEILFCRPAPGLLREIHLALKAAATELLAGKSC